MNFQQKMAVLKDGIDLEMEKQFDIAISEVGKEDKLIVEALEQTKKIALAGGKRIRGALLCQAYFGFGGKEKVKILKVAAAIELVHLFLLVHDDIIDRGDLRHGQETIHEMFARKYQKKYTTEGATHLGNSMAIIVGDLLYSISQRIILEAGFSFQLTSQSLLQLQKIVAKTIVGQSQDIAIEYCKNVTQEEVLEMYENKTARYTFEGPLHLGAMLAECSDKKTMQSLSRYALPLGIAFQIQDDILGVFGNEDKIGKSVGSDIEEGKQSLLVIKTRELGILSQNKKLNAILGKKNLSQKEISIFQDILKSSGSLEYSKNEANLYIRKAKLELEKIIMKKDEKDFLIGLNQYLEERDI
jgi:geranylgeranyl diphosphate synthase type I